MAFVHLHRPPTPTASDLCFVIQEDRLLAQLDASGALQLPDLKTCEGWALATGQTQSLGFLEGQACWSCAILEANAVPPAGWEWFDTRTLLSAFTPAQMHAVSCARELHWWHTRHRFCGRCGKPTVDVVGERAKKCPACNALFFPVISPAVIVAVTRGNQILLAHNHNFRPGMFSLLAGFVDPGETLEQASVREVREEVGIEIEGLQYISSQPWPFPNSLMVGFSAKHVSGQLAVDGKEIEQAGWFTRAELPEIPRKGTVARSIIDAWLREQLP